MVKIAPIVMVKVALLSFVSAFLILAAQMIVSMTIPVCMVGSLAAAGTAYVLGGFIHKVSGYKDGKLLAPLILVPLIIGFLLNPFGGLLTCIHLMTLPGAAFDFTFLLPFLVTPIVSCLLIMVQPNQIRTK